MRNYEAIGLRVGLEIHQQLDSGNKLFCHCSIAPKGKNHFPFSIERRMRPAAGELAVVDPAAIYEFFRHREFIYRYNRNSSCLVELDEEPPSPLNKKALYIALQIARLLRADIVDELHVMRKTVIDGSAVSGFQRTALLATNGEIDTSFGPLAIRTIMLEEDAATPLNKRTGVVEYRLDRLGVPLVELATSSDIHTPEQAKEAAKKMGKLLRSVSVVRGIGSIRQDINISIRNGARIELKGFQELEKIPDVVANEAERQLSLIDIKATLEKRGFTETREFSDVTDILKNTKNNFLRKSILSGNRIVAIKLPKFAGLLSKKIGDRTFGKELSAYAAAYGFGIIHSDENIENHSLGNEFQDLRKQMKTGEQDAVLIVAGNKLESVVNALLERINYCIKGVPEETRVADVVGSRYTRPLPGAGRLYPESDIPAIKIHPFLEKVKVPKTLEERKADLDLPGELAEQVINSPYLELYEKLKKYGPVLVASTLMQLTALRRDGILIEKISKSDLEGMFSSIKKGAIAKDTVPEILKSLSKGEEFPVLLKKYEQISDEELVAVIKNAIKSTPEKKENIIIGKVMKQVHGKASGARVARLLRREL